MHIILLFIIGAIIIVDDVLGFFAAKGGFSFKYGYKKNKTKTLLGFLIFRLRSHLGVLNCGWNWRNSKLWQIKGFPCKLSLSMAHQSQHDLATIAVKLCKQKFLYFFWAFRDSVCTSLPRLLPDESRQNHRDLMGAPPFAAIQIAG